MAGGYTNLMRSGQHLWRPERRLHNATMGFGGPSPHAPVSRRYHVTAKLICSAHAHSTHAHSTLAIESTSEDNDGRDTVYREFIRHTHAAHASALSKSAHQTLTVNGGNCNEDESRGVGCAGSRDCSCIRHSPNLARVIPNILRAWVMALRQCSTDRITIRRHMSAPSSCIARLKLSQRGTR
jgi:hypothetical protein